MKYNENTTSIDELISNAVDKIKAIVDSSTIVGDSIVSPDGTQIIPISKVAVGFVVGGGEYADLSARRVANLMVASIVMGVTSTSLSRRSLPSLTVRAAP